MTQTLSRALDDIGALCTQMVASYGGFAKRHGIGDNELAVLYALYTKGRCTQKQIATQYLIAKQTVHTVCKRYEEQGFIQSGTGGGDKREKVLALTAKGEDFARPIVEALLLQEEKAGEAFGAARLDALLHELSALQAVLSAHLAE